MNTSSELIQKWLSKINAIHNGAEDLGLWACVKHLRKIYISNNNRIKEVDGSSNGHHVVIATTTGQRCVNVPISRVATPSPTPEDEAERGVDSSGFPNEDRMKFIALPTPHNEEESRADYNNIDSGQRKRQRRAINCNKCTIN